MGSTMAILLTLNLTFSLAEHSMVEGWRGIVPLHSTRADVERLLGLGTNECKCGYYLDDLNVFFVYSSTNCETSGSGAWDVPLDTVLGITVYPKLKPRFSDLRIDKTKFIERHDGHIENIVSYFNEDEGLIIEVNRELDMVMGFYYVPAAKDQHLRCGNSSKNYLTLNNPETNPLQPRFNPQIQPRSNPDQGPGLQYCDFALVLRPKSIPYGRG